MRHSVCVCPHHGYRSALYAAVYYESSVLNVKCWDEVLTCTVVPKDTVSQLGKNIKKQLFNLYYHILVGLRCELRQMIISFSSFTEI